VSAVIRGQYYDGMGIEPSWPIVVIRNSVFNKKTQLIEGDKDDLFLSIENHPP